MISEVFVSQSCGPQIVGCLLSPEPGPALTLRVYQQGVASRTSHQNAILNTQLVRWQPLHSFQPVLEASPPIYI